MERINGGDTESLLCSLAFDQLGFWNAVAFGLAFPGAVVGVAVGGLVLAAAGTAFCNAVSG